MAAAFGEISPVLVCTVPHSGRQRAQAGLSLVPVADLHVADVCDAGLLGIAGIFQHATWTSLAQVVRVSEFAMPVEAVARWPDRDRNKEHLSFLQDWMSVSRLRRADSSACTPPDALMELSKVGLSCPSSLKRTRA